MFLIFNKKIFFLNFNFIYNLDSNLILNFNYDCSVVYFFDFIKYEKNFSKKKKINIFIDFSFKNINLLLDKINFINNIFLLFDVNNIGNFFGVLKFLYFCNLKIFIILIGNLDIFQIYNFEYFYERICLSFNINLKKKYIYI